MEQSTVEETPTQGSESWTSWDNPVATPERWTEIRRAVEAGMSMSEASKVFKISYEAMKKRAQREEWITEKRLAAVKAANLVPSQSPKAESALLAIAESFESHKSQTLLGLAKLAGKGIEKAVAANLEIENWQDAKIVADIAMKLHNVGQDSVQVNIAQAFAGMDEGPVIETEVSSTGLKDDDHSELSESDRYFVDDE